MDFLAEKREEGESVYWNGPKRRRKKVKELVSVLLCIAMLGTSVGVWAEEQSPMPNTVSTSSESGSSGENASSDVDASGSSAGSSGEAGESSAPSSSGKETSSEESSASSDVDASGSSADSSGEAGESSAPSSSGEETSSEESSASSVIQKTLLQAAGNRFVTSWTWVDEEEILTEYGGAWCLGLPGVADVQEIPMDELRELLPRQINAELFDGTTEMLDITWDFSGLSEEPQVNYLSESTQQILCRIQAVLPEGYMTESALQVWLDVGGASVYATYPGTRRKLTAADIDANIFADHVVQGITPAGTTVNLFDYDPQIGSNGDDLLQNGPDAIFTNHSNGINKDALLLFGGSAMRGAGFWNQGSGAGRPWGKVHTNMKDIVRSKLENGYPYINLEHARDELEGATGTASDNWGTGVLMDVANLNHAEYEGAGVSKARALSVRLLQSRGLMVTPNTGNTGATETVSGNCAKASLDYLFNPDTFTAGKEIYTDVDGLFQVDEDGYYYYDARKNFAELKTDNGNNSFTLYDGPAVWRTDAGYNPDTNAFDGDMSLGNFFPFDSASKVFDSIQTADKAGNETNILSCSEDITNVSNAVKANHYMGMTMQVDFTQPENGKLNMGIKGKQPMVFQFSGDDDVWVFIDDVLVLDLGGVHSELYGTIDFSTGEVITGQSWRTGGLPDNPGSLQYDEKTTLYDLFVNALGQDKADELHWVNNNGNMIFPTGTEHQLKMFYLERGNYDSSLQMRFNLQPSLYHSIKKVDQNGDPLEGVEFKLYAATANNGDSADAADYKVNGDAIGTLTTDKDGKSSFVREDSSPFSFTDQYHADGTLYYILKETKTAGGYRALPKDIVLKFNPDTSMLVVANRYQTGAYASFFSNIRETGTITYGQFNEQSGVIASSNTDLSEDSKKRGLIVAVPMLLESKMSHDDVPQDGKWLALYGSNTEGYGAVSPAERTAVAWREAVLKAALYQASDERWPEWRLTYNQDTGRLEGLLEDLPGRADRYALNNPDGDMKMVYGVIEPSGLKKLNINIEGSTSEKLYDELEKYVSGEVAAGKAAGKTVDKVIDEIVDKLTITGDSGKFEDRDFSFLNTDQFQREFRSIIYIPNERRELRIWKVDEDGKGVNGVTFTLYDEKGAVATGKTAQVDGRDGMLIFRPGVGNQGGYADITWADVGSKYTLKETSAPTGYELNKTPIPVVVGIYSIYADAGAKDDGVTVMAGVGKLMQTMTKYAADDMVNITLRDITATAQTQPSGLFEMTGWQDEKLAGTDVVRSMNLHYGINAVVDYGLHDEDGGQNIYPFFTTDVGFLRTRVVQNTVALQSEMYVGSSNTANWDDLSGRDLTSLFSLLNTVVVTDQKTPPKVETGKLRIKKTVAGNQVTGPDYTHKFTFTVSLKKSDGSALEGEYYYYGEQLAGYIRNDGTISLHHDEALTVLGLPVGTKWTVKETLTEAEAEAGWKVSPGSGTISGTILNGKTVEAEFINTKGTVDPGPGTGALHVSKTVTGTAGETDRAFRFTVTLDNKKINGTYGGMTFTDGVAEFTLKDGETVTATGLPKGIAYTVTEAEANQDGYTTTATAQSGTIVDNSYARFYNHRGDEPPEKPEPSKPAESSEPTKPSEPTEPSEPAKPSEPSESSEPTEPSEPAKPEKTDPPVDKVPQTSDETDLALWVMIMTVSGIGLISALVLSKRLNKKGKHTRRYQAKHYK